MILLFVEIAIDDDDYGRSLDDDGRWPMAYGLWTMDDPVLYYLCRHIRSVRDNPIHAPVE